MRLIHGKSQVIGESPHQFCLLRGYRKFMANSISGLKSPLWTSIATVVLSSSRQAVRPRVVVAYNTRLSKSEDKAPAATTSSTATSGRGMLTWRTRLIDRSIDPTTALSPEVGGLFRSAGNGVIPFRIRTDDCVLDGRIIVDPRNNTVTRSDDVVSGDVSQCRFIYILNGVVI